MPIKATRADARPPNRPAANTAVAADRTAAINNGIPDTLIQTLPAASSVFNRVGQLAGDLHQIKNDMENAAKRGAVQLARAFVVLKNAREALNELNMSYGRLFDEYQKVKLPEAFEHENLPHVAMDEGFRVGISHRTFASIKSDQREEAYAWLKKHGMESLITETVNSSTLSAAAKTMMEEQNIELPEQLFTVALVPNTSVTAIKK